VINNQCSVEFPGCDMPEKQECVESCVEVFTPAARKHLNRFDSNERAICAKFDLRRPRRSA
jgi:hypothetical protein